MSNNRAMKLRELLVDGPDGWARWKYVDAFNEFLKQRHQKLIREHRSLKEKIALVQNWEEEAILRAQLRKVRNDIRNVRREIRTNVEKFYHEWVKRAAWSECTRQCWSAVTDNFEDCDCRCIGEFHGLLRRSS